MARSTISIPVPLVSRLLGVYDSYRRHNQAEAFTELAGLAARDCFTEHEAEALNALTRMVIVTGKDLRSLGPAAAICAGSVTSRVSGTMMPSYGASIAGRESGRRAVA
jgi:hypothetical protein